LVLAGSLVLGPQTNAESTPAAEVLALEQKIEAAVVRGDVAFVDRVLSADFRFVHGDGWTTGGKALMEFERVYAKRDGRWKLLSHRTVHGPTVSPAGVDPAAARPRP